MTLPTPPPSSWNAPMTPAATSPPAIAYSTVVNPSSFFQTVISDLTITLNIVNSFVLLSLPSLRRSPFPHCGVPCGCAHNADEEGGEHRIRLSLMRMILRGRFQLVMEFTLRLQWA